MGQLVMSFRGLCMHLTYVSGLLPGGVAHRVIAADASHGANPTLVVKGAFTQVALPAHHCFLQADQPTLDALRIHGVPTNLDGWRISLTNGVGSFAPPSIQDIPGLRSLRPDLQLVEGVSKSGAPEPGICCFVDLEQGRIEENQYQDVLNPGYFTTWTVSTDGDPKLLFLHRDGTSIPVTVPSTPPGQTFKNGVLGSMVLHNSTTSEQDKDLDFALQFLVAQGGIPPEFSEPLPGSEPDTSGPVTDPIHIYVAFDMTPSCSNSQFP